MEVNKEEFKVNYDAPDEELYHHIVIDGVEYRNPKADILKRLKTSIDTTEYLTHIFILKPSYIECFKRLRTKCLRDIVYTFGSPMEGIFKRYPFIRKENK